MPSAAIAQLNCRVGDISGNAEKILRAARLADDANAAVLVTPELSLTGYPPEDLLLDSAFLDAADSALQSLARELPTGLAALIGAPHRENNSLYNAAFLIRGGGAEKIYRKIAVPNYEVFDEKRYFAEGEEACVFDADGIKMAALICADAWHSDPPHAAKMAGAEVALVLNASPFHLCKQNIRMEKMRAFVAAEGMHLIYCNMVGGQDELVFDGASFAMNSAGRLTAQLPAFEESFAVINIGGEESNFISSYPKDEDAMMSALTIGIGDYARKTGFGGALLGLSGGIDSALTLALAVDSLGASQVTAAMMPSQFTSQASIEDAAALAKNFGVNLLTIPIDGIFRVIADAIKPAMESFPKTERGRGGDVTLENVQARIRGLLLMALSNRSGRLLLATGNKSEFACGYATLYGDMAGGFAPLKDVSKTWIYRLARHINKSREWIPSRVISRAPSAELRSNQTDQDTLPPYDLIDAVVAAQMDDGMSSNTPPPPPSDDAVKILRMLRASEYKRRQSPPGIKVSARAFGKDWRMPIASGFRG